MADPHLKHRQVYEYLKSSIMEGRYVAGEQIPTEAQLQDQFKTSRITVSRAVCDLARDGFLVRRRGAGSFVSPARTAARQPVAMLVPGEFGGIFVPMCGTITRELEAVGSHLTISSLERGDAASILRRAEDALRRYRDSGVRGLFLVPFELPPDQMWLNEQIADTLSAGGLSVVLLDRDICGHPQRSRFDLVGSANHDCAYRLTTHLARLGRRRIAFVAGTLTASTTTARLAGYRDALAEAGLPPRTGEVLRFPYDMLENLTAQLRTSKADAYVCNNDHMAVHVMRDLLALGRRVPEDVAVVGIDDVDYAALVPVPLTTMRQPLEHIARGAARLLLDRLADPSLPPRKISFACELVIRKSCGAILNGDGCAASA
jgi:DNA-binding LacI/PurR family transcriptional regulator